ncbi:hypothetical protein BP5796_05925 [Coleophoma crateriformis]|uniref:Mannosyltransferase n=1 Tax=Coleophoma crateriformis TaxID=565419 RepID=A0A3D8RVJ1_9HELO|nr:hypothetical protein BP5796_05925 [Coleophoma crateriformis]
MMKLVDFFLSLLIPISILLHLFLSPYTKVEESFNIQATHDILVYATPSSNIFDRLTSTYDHFSFPGVVPRTFVGAAVLAGLARPIFTLVSFQHGQIVVRALLGLFNAAALLKYRNGVERTFGIEVARWYVLLQVAQFHVLYYASRTLPNMFAFGLTTLAFREFLPLPSSAEQTLVDKRHRLGIYLFVLSGVIFRSEIAVLLFTQLLYILVTTNCNITNIVKAGLQSAAVALLLTIPVDSYFWQKGMWPELAGFYYNAIQGKSADWGTSPYHYYFTNGLPKLLLNPLLTFVLIPYAITLKSFRFHTGSRVAVSLTLPAMLFVAIYSLQPHKEPRFIIYVVPPLTACAALSASHIWTRRTKNALYGLASLALVGSILVSFAASTGMLLISSLNYPGGEALKSVHKIIESDPSKPAHLNIHMDVLSCMTGVTRFQQIRPDMITYDKTEEAEELLRPDFWSRFDYVLSESPETVIGKWDVVDTIYAYAGIEILKPGMQVADLYTVNNATKVEEGREQVLQSEDVREVYDDRGFSWNGDVDMVRILGLLRNRVRALSGGWWIGPRMKPAIYVLKKQKEALVGRSREELVR